MGKIRLKKNKYCGTVKVGSSTYRVQVKDSMANDSGQGLLGQAHHVYDKITLSKGFSKYRMYKVFWHELIHSICNERSLELEENEVDNIANGLVLLFHDNPQLLKMVEAEKFDKNNLNVL